MKEKFIKKLAESLRKKVDSKFNFSDEMDLSFYLDQILERFHIRIVNTKDKEFKNLYEGKLFFIDGNNILLRLPSYTTPLRDNELKAKKLFIVLFYLNGLENSTYIESLDSIYNKDSQYYGMEYYARRFALYFLMPTKKFNKAKKELKSIQLLAAKFQVSTDFVKERLEV